MIFYYLELPHPRTHQFQVRVHIPNPQADQIVSLPTWIPGSYLIREFAKHLSALAAHQGGRALNLTQLDKSTWIVHCAAEQSLELSYTIYAFDNSVRTAYLDDERGFFNGTSLFLRVHGFEDAAQQLTLGRLPKAWQAYTAMTAVKTNAQGAGQYRAQTYDELVDHPFTLGRCWQGEFTVRGVPHILAVLGALPSFDGERLLADTQRICETEIRFWHGRGKPHFERYVFLLHVVEDGYGGLEHRASTALIASRKDLPRRGAAQRNDGYITLLGLISHEYFHTWNVKRLKPTAFEPYDYAGENYTQLLWFFEGFTSYYDDLILLRSSLIDTAQYLQLLAKNINHVLSTPGRRVQSLAQASWDAWIKYYRPDENTANITVSYYTKGAVLGLCLDLSLRLYGHSLDELMRTLLARGCPLDANAIYEAIETLSNPALRREFQQWVQGTDELPVQKLLAEFATQWQELDLSAAQRLGVKLQESPAGLKIQHVLAASVAYAAGLSAGDELIALDGWRVRKSDDLHLLLRDDQAQKLTIARDQQLLTLKLEPSTERAKLALQQIRLSILPQSDTRPAQRRIEWLGPKPRTGS